MLVFFHKFVGFALVWFCLFPLPPGVWERLRFVIVALPELYSYPFCYSCNSKNYKPKGDSCKSKNDKPKRKFAVKGRITN